MQTWRGHIIYSDFNGQFWYEDGTKVKDDIDRACGHCGQENTSEGHDACLGTLPNVMNACCGHGSINDAYIQYYDGSSIYGQEAKERMEDAKEKIQKSRVDRSK
jgi:hypothetical protein